eukprot:3799766-Pleurochrysis_carterae.AAC.1
MNCAPAEQRAGFELRLCIQTDGMAVRIRYGFQGLQTGSNLETRLLTVLAGRRECESMHIHTSGSRLLARESGDGLGRNDACGRSEGLKSK